jgi:hypothetical protein
MDGISEECGADQVAVGSAWSEPVVSVRGLVKRYGSHEAVAGIEATRLPKHAAITPRAVMQPFRQASRQRLERGGGAKPAARPAGRAAGLLQG